MSSVLTTVIIFFAIIEPRMSRFPFTHPAVITVLLLTLATTLVVSSDQEREASYERLPPGNSYDYLQSSPSEIFYSTRSLLECAGLALSNQSEFFTYNNVRLVVYKEQTAVVSVVFDGRDATLESWFSLQNLKSSPWSDLPQSPVNYFSMGNHWIRHFYISSNHGGCDIDRGWLIVAEGSYCPWERFPHFPAIIYSGEDSKIVWNDGFETADSMAIFIRLKP
ncbi:Hypothetical predicted protein [Octopus vulgaris]|uniref:Uncharacterized protein n=1 Tax=Octopus vulgaris TaxID=6645 RepID=A0AA36BX85_OCTVU|nr:Hypothetical predicted protein [Octopus vulgaris]